MSPASRAAVAGARGLRLPWAPAVLLLSFLVASAPLAHAQRRKKEGPKPEELAYFDGDLEQARTEAAQRNVPVLVLCVKEGEEANARFRDQLRDNTALAGATHDLVVILVNDGTHALVERRVRGPDGEKVEVEVCEDYHTRSCDVHRRNWDAVYQQFVVGPKAGLWELPEVIVLSPGWEIDSRIYHGQPPGDAEIVTALQKARVKAGPGITRGELVEVERLAAEGRRLVQAKLWAEGWRAWDGVLATIDRGPYGSEASAAREVALGGMRADLERAKSLLTPETVREGYRSIARMLETYAGSPLEKQVETVARGAERDPALKDSIRALKVELEAEALLREAEQLYAAGEEGKAKALIRKLLGRKYAETEAARLAREKYPD